MSSFIMSKSEVVVLFDLMAVSSIPVGIKDLPQVDEFEYERIVDSFSSNRLIDKTSEKFKPDKGLEQFLLPVVMAERIMLFNYGLESTCSFNASLYFAKRGLTALLDNGDGTIKFLTIDSLDDLLLFTPDLKTPSANGTKPYVSFILFDTVSSSSIVHCTRIDPEKNIARIVEGKRTPDTVPLESASDVEVPMYKQMLYDKLKEVYGVVGC